MLTVDDRGNIVHFYDTVDYDDEEVDEIARLNRESEHDMPELEFDLGYAFHGSITEDILEHYESDIAVAVIFMLLRGDADAKQIAIDFLNLSMSTE